MIEALRHVQAAQRALHAGTGGYAATVATLTATCKGMERMLPPEALATFEARGYALVVRPSRAGRTAGVDCEGRALTSDYVVSAWPVSASAAARQAYTGLPDGRMFLFYDGIAPSEGDIAKGLATPVAERESFTIP